MSRMRRLFDKYERVIMIVLVVVILIIFTVTGSVVDALRGNPTDFDPTDTAGTFSLLKGEKTNISYEAYEQARATYSRSQWLFAGGGDRVRPSQVWTYMVLLAAAHKEGITISDQELTDQLRNRILPRIFNDRPLYKQWIRDKAHVSPRTFEEGVREYLTALRVREIYIDSFLFAPPATREEMVKQYTGRNIEFARISWLRLPAKAFLKASDAELKASSDPDKELKGFFERDPAVTATQLHFRSPRRFDVEFLGTAHKVVDDAAIERMKALFEKTWPEINLEKINPKVKEMRDFFNLYQDRLLEQAGTDLDEVPADDPAKDEEKKDGDEEKKDESEEKKDEGEEGDKQEEKAPELTDEQQKSRLERAFLLVSEQVERELMVRGFFWHLRNEAGKDPKQSLKALFDLMRKHDDEKDPVLSTDPDKGLIVLFTFEKSLTSDEIEELAIRGDKFTLNGRLRVTQLSRGKPPAVSKRPETAGREAHLRILVRLIEVKQASRKTYAELDAGEKETLRAEFYLPANARERAKARLEELRRKCESGEVTPAAFAAAGRSLGGTVIEDEWMLAASRFMSEPVKELYWADEYRHMRDRHFLRRTLATILGADRVKPRYKAGSYLPVQTDAREDVDDPGAAYLVLLLERKKPTAETMPVEEFDAYVSISRRQRQADEQQRWSFDFAALKNQFEMEFFGDMLDRIEDEMKALEEARRKRRRR